MKWPLENSIRHHFIGRKVKDLKDRKGTIVDTSSDFVDELFGYQHTAGVIFEGQEGVGAQRVPFDNLEIMERSARA